MHIRVLYFAQLREEAGLSSVDLTVEEGITVSLLFKKLFSRGPTGIRFAVNQSYVNGDCLLHEGDEVAFIPPLGGG
jgi:molybdopterin converting factor subunit 1